ncbi:hypothetical protein D3C78_1543390 [compost metagenome]
MIKNRGSIQRVSSIRSVLTTFGIRLSFRGGHIEKLFKLLFHASRIVSIGPHSGGVILRLRKALPCPLTSVMSLRCMISGSHSFIIRCSEFGIAQGLISFNNLYKPRLCLIISVIYIRMIAFSQLTVSLLDFGLRRLSGNTKLLVIIDHCILLLSLE